MSEWESAKVSFAKNIKIKRLEKGWSQTKLAEIVGAKSSSTVGNWEAAISTPDFDTLRFLAELFETTIDSLLGKPDYSNEEKQTLTENNNDIDLLQKYYFCDEIGQDAIEACVDHHYNRCNFDDSDKATKKNKSKQSTKLFINENDTEYDEMKAALTYLKTLRKKTRKTCYEITKYLWGCGYGDEICLGFILDMFGRGINCRVPSKPLFDDIEAFLKGDYIILSKVKEL